MLSRFWKNKDDGSSKSGPPGHRPGQPGGPDAAGGGAQPAEPVGGGFFNLPPTVAKGPPAYGAPSAGASSAGAPHAGGGVPSQYGRPTNTSGGQYSVPSYGAPQPPQYGQPQVPSYGNHTAAPPAPSGGGMDMFGGMSLKAPAAAPSGYGGAPHALKPSPVKYGGYGAPHQDAPPSAAPAPSGTLFSGLDLAPAGASGAPPHAPYGHEDEIVRPAADRRKSGGSVGRGGTFNYLDVAATSGSTDVAPAQRQSIGPGIGATARPGASKNVKKKKTKSFRPGFGRQLSDESIAALQRGDLNPEDVMQHQQTAEETAPSSQSRIATNATDLAHLLPPVRGGSVLAGLTVHDGGSTSTTSGGSVLAGLTVHGGNSPRGSSKASPPPSEGGLLAGLNVHRKPSVDEHSDASTSVVLPSSNEKPVAAKKKTPSEPEKPAAPPTPEEKLLNTLRDFHASAVSFRNSSLKQNEEENKILERKVQLAKQLTQYEIDLRTIEAQQQQAVEVEDFEKADALNSTINSVRHCITLSESDVRKVDNELIAFVKAKEKAFTNQLRSTRGTLKELEKFRDDQDAERSALRDELKKYELEQAEHLQFEAERIETELHHVSSNMDHLTSEKGEIEATIEEQCKAEISLREELLVEKAGVHEEIVELERQLQIKLEQMRGIQASIDKAEKDIDAVRSRYSRQLKRIDDREEGLLKTKAEVEADAEQLKEEKKRFADTIQDYGVRISAFGKRMKAAKKEMRAAMLLATVLEVQETRREQATIRKKQQTAELTALADSAAIAEQSFMMLRKQHEELEKSLTVHHNAIASAQAMIPQLEQEKKAAAAQRNFKEAARISKDIKALEKDQSTAEEMVEVVEMELQDLKERIEKRETEYEEKKEELKTVEKQLELNTLHELWKESKSLRRSLRKFEKVKSDGIAAADGIDFRSSALLLVQAEYDACIAQAEALEAKYDLTDPAADEEDEDVEEEADDDDDSADEDAEDHLPSAALLSSPSASKSIVESADQQNEIGKTQPVDATTLEELAEKMAELEYLIEEATENEEYERAAKLDEQLESLRQREASFKATLESANVQSTTGVVAEHSPDGHLDHGYEEQGDDEDEGNTPEELENELRLLRARIKMLEADIERDTENEDYETAAELQEELQQLLDEEAEIVELLSGNQHQGTDGSNEHARADPDPSSGESMSLFGGLEMNSATVEVKTEVADSDSSNSMFAGLQMGAPPTDAIDKVTDESANSGEISAGVTSPKDATSPRRLSVGSGPNSPRRKSSLSMFSGLQVSSAPVDSPRKSSIASLSDEPLTADTAPVSEAVTSAEETAMPLDSSVQEDVQAGSTQADPTVVSPSSDSLFGGLSLTSKSEEAASSDDGVIVEAEEVAELQEAAAQADEANATSEEAASSPLDMFSGLSLVPAPVAADSITPPDASAADVVSSSLDMFGGLSLAGTSNASTVENTSLSSPVASAVVEPEVPASPLDMFGGLSLAPTPAALDEPKPTEE